MLGLKSCTTAPNTRAQQVKERFWQIYLGKIKFGLLNNGFSWTAVPLKLPPQLAKRSVLCACPSRPRANANLGSECPLVVNQQRWLQTTQGEDKTVLGKIHLQHLLPCSYQAFCWSQPTRGGKAGLFCCCLIQRRSKHLAKRCNSGRVLICYLCRNLELGGCEGGSGMFKLKPSLERSEIRVTLGWEGTFSLGPLGTQILITCYMLTWQGSEPGMGSWYII